MNSSARPLDQSLGRGAPRARSRIPWPEITDLAVLVACAAFIAVEIRGGVIKAPRLGMWQYPGSPPQPVKYPSAPPQPVKARGLGVWQNPGSPTGP